MTEIDINNPFHILYNKLDEILKLLPDVNSERANRTSKLARQFIFPNYPESNDEDYPRVRIQFNNPRVQEYGAAQYIQDIEDDDGNTQKTQYGQYLSFDVNVGVFVKKDQFHKVETENGKLKTMKNQMLGDFMMYRYFNLLRQNRDKFIEIGFDFSEDSNFNLSPTYDDNHFLFASEINFSMYRVDVWNINYSPTELINTILYNDIEVDRYEEN